LLRINPFFPFIFICFIFLHSGKAFCGTDREADRQQATVEDGKNLFDLKAGEIAQEFPAMQVDAQKEFKPLEVDAGKEFKSLQVDAQGQFPNLEVDAKKTFSSS